MLWKGQRQSDNVEDRRGMSGGGMAIGGGLGGIVVVVIALLLGADPRQLLEQTRGVDPSTGTTTSRPTNPQEDESKQFSATVLASTEDVWADIFRQQGRTYSKPTLVLLTEAPRSACGESGPAVGAFDCPGHLKLYLDLSFFKDLQAKFHAPGRFAPAYVIAHERGQHV